MKSLHKTLDVFEFILNRDGLPATPGEIASAIEINVATCSRILSELMQRGYIEKVSRNKGYIAGPVLYAMNLRQSVYARIAGVAREPIREMAIELGAMINISVMRDCYRYVLCYFSGDETRKFPLRTRYFQDHYTTATGRLLLSTAPEKDLDFVCAGLGLPGESWNGISSREELVKELEKINLAGSIKFRQKDMWIIGSLVHAPDFPPAAIGFGIHQDKKLEKAMTLLNQAVAVIEKKLTARRKPQPSFY